MKTGYYWAQYSPNDAFTIIRIYEIDDTQMAECLGSSEVTPAADWILHEQIQCSLGEVDAQSGLLLTHA